MIMKIRWKGFWINKNMELTQVSESINPHNFALSHCLSLKAGRVVTEKLNLC